jgi:hypothetical protein
MKHMLHVKYILSSKRAIYDTITKDMAQPEKACHVTHNGVRKTMPFACWVIKTKMQTMNHNTYLILTPLK